MENCIWENLFSVYEYLLTLPSIKSLYDGNSDDINTQQNIYRLLYVALCIRDDTAIIDKIVSAFNFNGDIIAKFLDFDYPKPEKNAFANALPFDETELMGRIASKYDPLATFKKLSSLLTAKQFVEGALVSDLKNNKNALEYAIYRQK